MARKNKSRGRRGERFNAFEEEPYRVGHGHPPKDTQFKPGKSGNPKGRRRKAPSFSEVTEQVLNKKIEMRAGDQVLRMSNKEALIQSAIRQALAGKPRLLAVLPAIMRYESESLQDKVDAGLNLAADDEAILSDFLARHRVGEEPTDGD